LIVVRIEPEMGDGEARQEAVWSQIEGVVEGQLTTLDEIDGGKIADWGKIDKVGCRHPITWASANMSRSTN
jgi:hypothetical protein